MSLSDGEMGSEDNNLKKKYQIYQMKRGGSEENNLKKKWQKVKFQLRAMAIISYFQLLLFLAMQVILSLSQKESLHIANFSF